MLQWHSIGIWYGTTATTIQALPIDDFRFTIKTTDPDLPHFGTNDGIIVFVVQSRILGTLHRATAAVLVARSRMDCHKAIKTLQSDGAGISTWTFHLIAQAVVIHGLVVHDDAFSHQCGTCVTVPHALPAIDDGLPQAAQNESTQVTNGAGHQAGLVV